jgi:hypothetical protein
MGALLSASAKDLWAFLSATRGVLTGPDLAAGDVLVAVSQWLALPLHVSQDLVDHHCFGDVFKLAYAEWT